MAHVLPRLATRDRMQDIANQVRGDSTKECHRRQLTLGNLRPARSAPHPITLRWCQQLVRVNSRMQVDHALQTA